MTSDSYIFGPLEITFTYEFEKSWSSKGSGGSASTFYLPIPPKNFYALGSIQVGNYDDVGPSDKPEEKGNRQWAMCVKENKNHPSNKNKDCPALKPPEGFQYLWDDDQSNADMDGSVYSPIPPKGYKALGYVFMKGKKNKSENGPFPASIMCVREDLLGPAKVGKKVWDTSNSGAKNKLSCYEIDPATEFYAKAGSSTGLLAPNTLICDRKGDDKALNYNDVLHVLKLPFAATKYQDETSKPTLTSLSNPPEYTDPVLVNEMIVPFTAVRDKGLKDVKDSPFYKLERWVTYENEIYGYNNSNSDQTFTETLTTGISEEQTDSFNVSTGLTISKEWGITAGAEVGVASVEVSTKITASFSVEMGYSTSTSVSRFSQRETQHSINVKPGEAAVLWVATYDIRLRRRNGEIVPSPMRFSTDEFYITGYPAP